jgi:hypothetical protein
MTAALRYELRMQLRRPAMWSVTGLMLVILWLNIAPGIGELMREGARTAMIRAIIAFDVPLPIGFAFLLADRLVRDERLGVAALLDATVVNRAARLAGKYLGCVIATASPIAAVYFGFAAAYATRNAAPQALAWAAAMFAAIAVPALLFVGALSLCGPLVMPTTLFRVLFVGYWIWTSYLIPPRLVPTLAQTVVAPTGGYQIQVFFGYHGAHAGSADWAGPVPGALFNALRPAPTVATGWLSVAAIVGLAGVFLTAAHLIREHRSR